MNLMICIYCRQISLHVKPTRFVTHKLYPTQKLCVKLCMATKARDTPTVCDSHAMKRSRHKRLKLQKHDDSLGPVFVRMSMESREYAQEIAYF